MGALGTVSIILALLGLVGIGLVSATVWSDHRPRELSTRELADLARLQAPFAPEREALTPDEPKPQPAPAPGYYGGRHRMGEALGAQAQRARWNGDTGQVDVLWHLNWSPQEQEDLRSVTT